MHHTRESFLTCELPISCGLGLEIGPLDRPLVQKSKGRVLYVDYTDTATLRQVYRDDPTVAVDNVTVDVALGSRSLPEALGQTPPVDWIIASHVIEHVPNLVGWLAELSAVTAGDAQVSLAIPDRRFTFDYLRRTSTLSEALDAHLQNVRAPRLAAALDFYLNAADIDLALAWTSRIDPTHLTRRTPEAALDAALRAVKEAHTAQVHSWVFTPRSFAELMMELAALDLMPFRCTRFADTAPMTLEFLLGMTPCGHRGRIIDSWRQMATAAKDLGHRAS